VSEKPAYATVALRVGDDHVALVELNRPASLNAVSMGLYADILRVFGDVDDDPDCHVVVLAGRGRAFSVGADLKERKTMTDADVRRRRRLAPTVFGAMARCTKPVVAAVAGYALGGGCELALACDVIVVEESTVFALPETTLGVIPGGGGTQRLPRLVGLPRAKELILTGRRFTAREAEAWGMVNRVVPDGHAVEAATELARSIAANPPIALQQAKRALNASQSLDLDNGVLFEAEAYQACLLSDEWRRRMAAASEARSDG